MRVLFMGSGELGLPALDILVRREDLKIVGVVTQPDRPQGRSRKVAPCPVKVQALECRLPVVSTDKIGAAPAIAALAALEPELVVVAAYGQYLASKILTLPRLGCINIHPSLLPKYRGASPIQWALANGDTKTGVTILYVDKEMDAGDIILQEEVAIADDDTTASIMPRLAGTGADLLSDAIDLILAGGVERTPQDDAAATWVNKLEKTDGRVDWGGAAKVIRNRVRGFYPWPCCYCEVPAGSGHFLKILKGAVEVCEPETPGTVVSTEGEGPLVATGDGALRLLSVQPEGKKPMDGRAYLNGHRLEVGTVLG